MKTILLFSRANLSILYANISHRIKDARIIHVAYSSEEASVLRKYNISPDYIYLEMFRKEYDNCQVDEMILKKVDDDIIEYSEGHFNLNSAIQSDRGFSLLSNEEALRSAVAHYNVWESILKKSHIDLLEHELCSLFLNYIASILCKKQGGIYSYQIAVKNDRFKYAFLHANNGEYDFLEMRVNFDKYYHNPELIDYERCKKFISEFRKDLSVFMGNIINSRISKSRLFYWKLKERFLRKRNPYHRIYSNIEFWSYRKCTYTEKLANSKCYDRMNIRFENTYPEGEKYFFYPFHLEPEAVVQYLSDGIYTNQVKLIENIAASLPPGYFLYVKDHPHEFAYRHAEDYERLIKVPNIRLLNQNISGKSLIANSVGVITINGSAGFEALMMGKQVYCFGNSLYSFVPRVSCIWNIRELRESIYDKIDYKYSDDNELYAFVMALLSSTYSGYINGFVGGIQVTDISEDDNYNLIANSLICYVNQLDNLKEEANRIDK